jgi:hypothetical protein
VAEVKKDSPLKHLPPVPVPKKPVVVEKAPEVKPVEELI